MTSSSQGNACPEISQLLSLHLESVDPLLRESLEAHIDLCTSCQHQLQLDASRRCQSLPPQLLIQTPPKPAPGDLLAGCQLLKQLGHGAASVVWLALELNTHRQVAVKLIPAQPAILTESRRRWQSEVLIAARMQHPNLVRLYRAEETPNWFALVFEFIPGQTLAQKLHQELPPHNAAAQLLHTLASAVHAIHQQRVLHLDLKPSNILLDQSAGNHWNQLVPRISDFGVSADFSHHLPHSDSHTPHADRPPGCGTPPWTAPEQILLPPSQLTPAADVHALGSLLCALLTGQPTLPHDLPPNLPPELARIARKCLHKFPAQRFQSAMELAQALQPWCRTFPPGPPPANSNRKFAAIVTSLAALASLAIFSSPRVTLPEPKPSSAPAPTATGTQHSDFLALLAQHPAGLSPESASALADQARQLTAHTLATSPHNVPELLRIGLLLQRAGERMNSSIHATLYPAAARLMQSAEQLLAAAHALAANDQRILQELAAARIGLGSLKAPNLPPHPTQFESARRQQIEKLTECLQTASLMTDSRQQVYWFGLVLDACRQHILHLEWSGKPSLAEELRRNFIRTIPDQPARLTPDVQFRLVLWNPATIPSQLDAYTPDTAPWTFPENCESLKLEAVCNLTAFAVFQTLQPDRQGPTPDAHHILNQADTLITKLSLDPQLLPQIIHRELIRPIATVASECRALNQIEAAEHIQLAYLQLCRAAQIRFPNHPEVLLALSEAHLQEWKNRLRRDQHQQALNALRLSLATAEAAWQANPNSQLAYSQIADRHQRIERFKAGR